MVVPYRVSIELYRVEKGIRYSKSPGQTLLVPFVPDVPDRR
jgi:hypothetical protein